MEKRCYRCEKILPAMMFSKDSWRADGLSNDCKPCNRARRADHAKRNREAETARRNAWAKANPERNAAIKKKHIPNLTDAQLEAHRAKCRQYKKENPAAVRRYSSKRRAAKLNSVMTWNTELTNLVFAEACDLTLRLGAITGISWQVDHIIPLRGKIVSGLHVWNNLQVLTETANRKKRNSYIQE